MPVLQHKRTLLCGEQFCFEFLTLKCSCCFSGNVIITIGDDAYINACRSTQRWFEYDFIASFASLIAHVSHNEKIQLMHCPNPTEKIVEVECRNLKETVETIVCVVHGRQHFALLSIDVKKSVVQVFDGLGYQLSNWFNHVENILKRCKLLRRLHAIKWTNKRNKNIYHIENTKWKITKGVSFVKQLNGHDCGPIACLKIMSIFNRLNIAEIENTSDFIRNVVMTEFQDLLKLTKSVLFVARNTGSVKRRRNKPVGHIQSIMSASSASESDDNDDGTSKTSKRHKPAQHKLSELVKQVKHGSGVVEAGDIDVKVANVLSKLDEKIEHNKEHNKETDKIGNKNEFGEFTDKDKELESTKFVGFTPTKPINYIEIKKHPSTAKSSLKTTSTQSTNISYVTRSAYRSVRPSSRRLLFPNMANKCMTIDETRQFAIFKKRNRQDMQAEVMKQRRLKHGVQAVVGSIVSVQMDYRDVSHPRGIHGIVFRCSKVGAGGSQVVTEHGIIRKSGDDGVYYIPRSRYKVLDNDAIISDKSHKIRQLVVTEKFDEKSTAKLSMQKIHSLEYDMAEEKGACHCKKGCQKNCGCRKNGRKCNSKCRCRGKCLNGEVETRNE
jgi:hypothetical protein